MNDNDLYLFADKRLEQYFLVSADKIAMLYEAACIQPNDRVVELGAGVGTVTRSAPPCKSLTAVELDERLIGVLRSNAPGAIVVQGDALKIVQDLSFDVLIGNLPGSVTEVLLGILSRLIFRTAVLAVGESADIGKVSSNFKVEVVAEISGSDFKPSQPSVSRIVKIVPREEPSPTLNPRDSGGSNGGSSWGSNRGSC